MISTIVRAASCAAILALSSIAAEAATYHMSYEDSNGGLLTATIKGNLQADGDTVFVTAVLNAAFDGVAGPALGYVTSSTNYFFGLSKAAQLSLTGANNDLLACIDGTCFDGFAFIPGNFSGFYSVPTYTTGLAFGAILEDFDPSRYSLSAVPLPAGGLLLLSAFGGLAALRRKRAA